MTLDRIWVIATAIIIFFAAPAEGRNGTIGSGNDRMAGCIALERAAAGGKFPATAQASYELGICIGQINSALAYLCIPESVTVGQFAVVINKFLREHPERRNEDFNEIMIYVAAKSWGPCEEEKKEKL